MAPAHYQSTSRSAYQDHLDRIGPEQGIVYECLLKGGAMCDKEIAKRTGLDRNVVPARRGELRKLGLVVLAYKAKYEGKTVNHWSTPASSLTDNYRAFKEMLFETAQPSLWGGLNG